MTEKKSVTCIHGNSQEPYFEGSLSQYNISVNYIVEEIIELISKKICEMLKNTKNIVCNKGEYANTLIERIIFECLDKLNIFKNQSKIQPIIF